MNILLLIIVGISLLYESTTEALVVGSNSTVSIVSTCTVFPAADRDNTILGFTWLKGGFVLEDTTTSCTFDAVYPISGTVNLNGGTLYLLQDMILANPTQLKGLGTIIGNGHSIEFCETVTILPSDLKVIKDLNVFFDGDVLVTGTLVVQGNCFIYASGNMLEIADNVNIIVDADSTLAIHDTRLENVRNNLGCLADTSHIVLQDVLVCLMGYSHFLYGNITCKNNVKFVGSSTFWYDSAQPLYIDDEANLNLDGGVTFKIGKKTEDSQDPVKFYDEESIISCGECNFVITENGITLKRGRLEFLKNAMIDTEGTDTTHGIILGDGISEDEDMTVYLGPSSNVTCSAILTYNNVNPNKFYSSGPSVCLIRMFKSYFYVAKNFIYPSTDLIFEIKNGEYSKTLLADGAELYYNNMRFLIPGLCDITYYASRTKDYSCYLNGNAYIYIASGLLEDDLWVSNPTNLISGNGDAAGEITLADSNAQLILNLEGSLFNTMSLNGGSIKLNNDIGITTPNCFTSTGTINLDQYSMKFNYLENVAGAHEFNCPLNWVGKNGFIELLDDTTLQTTWIINGEITIDGNRNSLTVEDGAQIIVASNSHLTLKNMRLNIAGSDSLLCTDDSGAITLNNIHWMQDQDFAFTNGSLILKNNNIMSGEGLIFTYRSTQAISLGHDTNLSLDHNFTFSYAPSNNDETLIQFQDSSSVLNLNHSILFITSGLTLTKGKIMITADSIISMSGDGLTLGDQATDNDMRLAFSKNSKLTINSGTLIYKNINADSLEMNFGYLSMSAGATFTQLENIDLGTGTIIFYYNSAWAHLANKTITGSISGVPVEKVINP